LKHTYVHIYCAFAVSFHADPLLLGIASTRDCLNLHIPVMR
jgi:hypothetical protein